RFVTLPGGAGRHADHLALVPLDRARLVEVERQALGASFDDVGEDDRLEDVALGEPLCRRGAIEPGADNGDLLTHVSLLPTWRGTLDDTRTITRGRMGLPVG